MYLFGNIVTPSGLQNESSLEIDDSGRIIQIFQGRPKSLYSDYSGCYVVPGFVDLHVHGAGGADFMDGTVSAVRTALRSHAAAGTTTLLATTLTAPNEQISQSIRAIRTVYDRPQSGEARIGGIHLEGPYICSSRRGAQPLGSIRLPSVDEFAEWIALSDGLVRKITLAPEIDGAIDFIRYARSVNVNVSIGHTDADQRTVAAAIDAGADQATHLFNAMSPMTHRSPGAAGTLLADERVLCELICDGFHVDPAVVKVAVRAKGDSKIALITDAMSGTAMPDADYSLGGQQVIVHAGTARFADGTLAGSVLRMDGAFINVMKFSGVSAVSAARMSSANAAEAIGQESLIGSIVIGKLADLAIIDPLTSRCQATFLSGQKVYSA